MRREPETPYALLVVDNQPLLAEALARLLESFPCVTRVDRALAPLDGLREVLAFPYAVVVFRSGPLGDLDGVRLCSEVKRLSRDARVLLLGGGSAPEQALAALAAGADGLVPFSAQPAELERALATVAGGGRYLPHDVALSVLEHHRDGATVPMLSVRQRRILALVAAGRTNARIADELVMSLATTKRELTAIYEALGVAGREGAVRVARSRRIMPDEEPEL